MIKSMTGYGKGECLLSGGSKIIVEIKSLNGKNADINIKGQIISKEKELLIRKLISEKLMRGNIELSINQELTNNNCREINKTVFKNYLAQISQIIGNSTKEDKILLASSILKLPDIIENKPTELKDSDWRKIDKIISEAINNLDKYRITEGKALEKDITKRIHIIYSLLQRIEKEDAKRIPSVRKRLQSKISSSEVKFDKNRFEEELIYYLEKLDINEEKVRLKQHCDYFIQTIKEENNPGKKLGFIIQEIGREINTIGSKSNFAPIQTIVVKMKDELEKIREQSLNIL